MIEASKYVQRLRQSVGGNGYRVFPQVVPAEILKHAVDAICGFIGVDLERPDTWYRLPRENAGVVPIHNAQGLWETRQYPGVYEVFEQIYDESRLWVSVDRSAFRPPLREGRGKPDCEGWHESIGNIHWDASPANPHPGLAQGVLLLSDTPANAGGFQCIPALYRDLDSWMARHTGFDPVHPDVSGYEIVQVTGQAGDLIVWDPFLPHGPGSNFLHRPRIAQFITMFPIACVSDWEKECRTRIEQLKERRAPECWRGMVGQLDPEPGPEIRLNALGRRLVGLDRWD